MLASIDFERQLVAFLREGNAQLLALDARLIDNAPLEDWAVLCVALRELISSAIVALKRHGAPPILSLVYGLFPLKVMHRQNAHPPMRVNVLFLRRERHIPSCNSAFPALLPSFSPEGTGSHNTCP